MRVRVKLFATLSKYAGDVFPGTPIEVEVPPNASLQDLVEHLKIPPQETKILFVNGIIQSPDTILQAGDEVGIFPPVAGG